MRITPRPLAERLNRLGSGLAAHPEYIPSLIDSVKTAKLSGYLGDFDGERDRLQKRMRFTEADLNTWSYQDLAAYVADRYHSGFPSGKAAAVDLMDLLAAPMLMVSQVIKSHQGKGGPNE